MMERFAASFPDDPDADFADRLLLALGMWPRYRTDPALGEEGLIEAASKIRWDAHRLPMVIEDWSLERGRNEGFTEAVIERHGPFTRQNVLAVTVAVPVDEEQIEMLRADMINHLGDDAPMLVVLTPEAVIDHWDPADLRGIGLVMIDQAADDLERRAAAVEQTLEADTTFGTEARARLIGKVQGIELAKNVIRGVL